MKKLIIFDLDGTILDTLKDITISVNYMLEVFDMPTYTEKEIRYFVGRGPRYLIEKAVGKDLNEDEYNKLYEVYDKHYSVHKEDNTKPYDGFDELFKYLKQNGYLLAVCSNKQHSATKELMENLFPNTFDYVMGTTPKHAAKPSKDMLIHILKELNVSSSNTLYVGDTEIDMQAADNANITKIAALYGFRLKEELSIYNPFAFINKPLDLIDVVIKYFK